MRSSTFAARDFFETRQGVCRVLPPLTHRLAETAPAWARAVAPLAEDVDWALFRPEGRGARPERAMPTLLTGANRSAGREARRRRPERQAVPGAPALPPACRGCGLVLDDPNRAYCDGCLPDQRSDSVAVLASAGPDALGRLRAEGKDPAHGGEAGRKWGQRNADHIRAIAEWEGAGVEPGDDLVFAREVLPRLRSVPLRLMAEATGLSEGYCSFVRRGLKVPHRRHGAMLAQLVEGSNR